MFSPFLEKDDVPKGDIIDLGGTEIKNLALLTSVCLKVDK